MAYVTKAVIPAAGLGTRFLPATKAMPKEMLPVVDKPVIQFVVEEAVHSGVPHILMVTGRNKHSLENHFDRVIELETQLEAKGENYKLNVVYEATELADIHYVRQGDPRGLGHAVLKAKSFVSNEPFALLLGDEIIPEEESLLRRMIKIAEQTNGNVLALLQIPKSDVSKYGIAEMGNEESPGIYSLKSLIEKPSILEAPSNFALVGRYVLQPGIFEILENTRPGTGGEIQLTDALSVIASNPDIAGPLFGVIHEGRRFDMGDKLSSLKATVEIASTREDIGEEFTKWLLHFISSKQSD